MTMTTEDLRDRVATEMRQRGVAPVARELGITRESAMAFALGVESDGTRALVLSRLAQK